MKSIKSIGNVGDFVRVIKWTNLKGKVYNHKEFIKMCGGKPQILRIHSDYISIGTSKNGFENPYGFWKNDQYQDEYELVFEQSPYLIQIYNN